MGEEDSGKTYLSSCRQVQKAITYWLSLFRDNGSIAALSFPYLSRCLSQRLSRVRFFFLLLSSPLD